MGGLVEVDADEGRLPQPERHRHEVAAVAAAELEDARLLDRRRVEAAQDRLRGHAARMRLGERMAGVGQRVIGVGHRPIMPPVPSDTRANICS